MAQNIQYIDTPLVAGEEYQLTFNADVTSGVLVVKQGTTIIYQSDHLFFGGVGVTFDNINIIDYVYMCRVTNTVQYENINISENVQLEITSYLSVQDSVTMGADSFSASIVTTLG
jgi:hypothetical protein